MAGITLSELPKKMIEMGGSDLRITTNSAPRVRVHGFLRALDMPPLTAADTKSLAYSVLTDARSTASKKISSWTFPSASRTWRASAVTCSTSAARSRRFRTIPWEIKNFDALGLPNVVRACATSRGLVLVTGPTGSGNRPRSPPCSTKSTPSAKAHDYHRGPHPVPP